MTVMPIYTREQPKRSAVAGISWVNPVYEKLARKREIGVKPAWLYNGTQYTSESCAEGRIQ